MRTERIRFRHRLLWFAVCAFAGCDGPAAYHAPPADTRPNRPQADTVELKDVERAAFDGLNRLRRKHRLRPLVLRADLVAMARRHSRDMMTRGKLTHIGLDGLKLTGRADRAGVRYRAIGENVASNFGHADPGAKALDGWGGSPRHRRNMLDARFEETGVGAARCPKTGTWYFTNVFCLRRKD